MLLSEPSGIDAMSVAKLVRVVAIALFCSPFLLSTASAQFGTGYPGRMNLPQSDFRWTWGDRRSQADRGGIEDFSTLGNEGSFRCDLSGRLRIGSQFSRTDIRNLENDLRQSPFFVQAASNAMYTMEARGQLDWAALTCEIPQPTEDDQAARDKREARAMEKAARELERRRARRQREEERANSQ